MSVQRKVEASIQGEKSGFLLSELRWLVSQAVDMPGDTEVSLYYDAGASGSYSQFDRGYSSLSVSSEEV